MVLADVVEVAQPNAHMMLDVIRHRNSNGDSDQAVGEPEWKNCSKAPEQLTQQPSAKKGYRSQHGVRQVSHAEQEGPGKAGQQSVVYHSLEAGEEERLLDVLLNDRPANVSA